MFLARRRDRPNESQVSPRAEWYDRNPSAKGFYYYGANVAPHASATRISYTVPTNKKAILSSLFIGTRRVTAATTASLVSAGIYAIVAATSTWLLYLRHVDNTLNVWRDRNQGLTLLLSAGDIVEASTEDLSTGGANEYLLALALTEFTA